MAAGTMTWFDQALLDLGKGAFDLSSDTLKWALIKSAANGGHDPAVDDADPCWGAGGSTNLSSAQVGTGGTSYTGPVTIAGTTWTIVAGTPTLDGTDPGELAADASGFTDARSLVVYDDTHAAKKALAWMDLGADKSIAAGIALRIEFAAGGILTLNQA